MTNWYDSIVTSIKNSLEAVFIKKSNTSGLVKNDGTIDTSSYLSQSDVGNSSNTSSSKIVACNDSRLTNNRNPKSTAIVTSTTVNNETVITPDDLNNYTSTGFYYCANNTQSKNIKNTPLAQSHGVEYYTNDQAFTLAVENRGNANQVKQTLTYVIHNTYTPTGDTYVRIKTGDNNWKSWGKIFTDKNLPNITLNVVYTDDTTDSFTLYGYENTS